MKSLAVVAPNPLSAVPCCSGSFSDDSELTASERDRTLRSTVDGDKIRSRLLSRLGIVQAQPPEHKRIAPMRKVAPFSEPLKFKDEEDFRVHGSPGEERSPSPSCRKSVVAFDNEVSVVPIPKHQEYSKRIRSRLWCDKRELSTMAARNFLEYQSEGWNPSQVIEDEGFITMSTGEKIHPVHIQRLLASPFMMMRQPMRVMHLQPPMEVVRRPPVV
jgi:hypothetical protein